MNEIIKEITKKQNKGLNYFNIERLKKHWNNGTRLTYKNKKYRVGRMGYGQWFLETGREKAETEPFNKGTLWLEQAEPSGYFYKITN